MSDAIIYLDPDSKMNLQNQIRKKILDSRVGHSDEGSPERVVENAVWRGRIKGPPVAMSSSNDPPNWQKFPLSGEAADNRL